MFVTSCDTEVRSKETKIRQQSNLCLLDVLRVAAKFGNMKLSTQNQERVSVRVIISKSYLLSLFDTPSRCACVLKR